MNTLHTTSHSYFSNAPEMVSNIQSTFFSIKTGFFHIISRITALFIEKIQFIWSLRNRLLYKEGACAAFLHKKITQAFCDIVTLPHSNNVSISKTRDSYEKALEYLRNGAVDSSEHQQLAHHLFSSTKVYDAIREEMQISLPEVYQDFTEQNSYLDMQRFQSTYKNLAKQLPPPLRCLEEDFDPVLFGNIPFSWWEYTSLESNQTCKILRMPAATQDKRNRETGLVSSSVIPEFSHYINALKKKKETHLYVNLMFLYSPHERTRSIALCEFAKKNDSCIFVSLDKNSDFYLQKNQPSTLQAKFFFRNLTANLQDSHLNLWPETLLQKTIQDIQEEAISSVRSAYNLLDDEKNLSTTDRKVAIDLVHTEIIHLLLKKIKPFSCNISCKNCIDRGVAQQLELFSRVHPEKRYSKDFFTIAFAPSYLVSQRTMQHDRFTRLTLVLQKQEQKK